MRSPLDMTNNAQHMKREPGERTKGRNGLIQLRQSRHSLVSQASNPSLSAMSLSTPDTGTVEAGRASVDLDDSEGAGGVLDVVGDADLDIDQEDRPELDRSRVAQGLARCSPGSCLGGDDPLDDSAIHGVCRLGALGPLADGPEVLDHGTSLPRECDAGGQPSRRVRFGEAQALRRALNSAVLAAMRAIAAGSLRSCSADRSDAAYHSSMS
jgi:hypothetical protein